MLALNPVDNQNTASNRLVATIADLAEIFEPGVQVCSWQRAIDPRIASYLANSAPTGTVQFMETLQPNKRARLIDLPDAEGFKELRDDVSLLGEILFELLDCDTAGLRYTRVDNAMCPRWHADRVPLRMLCTYEGPGTEWLTDHHVARDQLAGREPLEGSCQRAATFDVVLLKGMLWHDNNGAGALHRSPAITPESGGRTLITLDPLWNA